MKRLKKICLLKQRIVKLLLLSSIENIYVLIGNLKLIQEDQEQNISIEDLLPLEYLELLSIDIIGYFDDSSIRDLSCDFTLIQGSELKHLIKDYQSLQSIILNVKKEIDAIIKIYCELQLNHTAIDIAQEFDLHLLHLKQTQFDTLMLISLMQIKFN
ncbi:unnamed protein product (macronuclear) [Paramecium tetraurelia]|uniref:Uncharacterized protein n=1 Tax=Paramecium tetraurelia TaxID=5888 RepID=A0D969_PARTE|nr:uncharacterized protein GSPATT00014532001 [Paramecium tetraurelia]CAK79586.1 unnamed protein product [Paramecium tetraurelia]|eukprot:XP_001446983.1 hypothetical protein (macronuclear) [Paramecium tetraurelia strain d4-2]